jgi:xylulose-5-phosphate/fructose-6-phosphate phosphoketolase
MRNQTDRYSLAIDTIDLIDFPRNKTSHVREKLINIQLAAKMETYNSGVDPEYIRSWTWPYPKK